MFGFFQNSNYEQDVPVKDSVVMKPDFSARSDVQDLAATKIQKQWRKYQEDSRKKESSDNNNSTFKMSEEVRVISYIIKMLLVTVLY